MNSAINAIVLAAGLSSRMGQSKALLPWVGGRTVIEQIVMQLQQVNLSSILVVTGNLSEKICATVTTIGASTVFNPDYAKGEMLSSLQVGLSAQAENISAILVVLGDQPRIEVQIVRQVVDAYEQGKGKIIAPIHNGERGHPILIDRLYWDEILALPQGGAPRDVIKRHSDTLHLIEVDTDTVVSDIDTPEDYEHERQRAELEP